MSSIRSAATSISLPILLFSSLLLLMGASSASAESCSSKCTDAGYANSHVDGTAPFCSGRCYNGSGDSQVEPYWANGTGYIDCAGSCSDGSSCWSGSKQCSCWNQINCSNQCLGGPLAEWGDYEATDSFCAERSDVSDLVSSGNKVRIVGACSWSDRDEAVQQCYCIYSPEVMPEIPGV